MEASSLTAERRLELQRAVFSGVTEVRVGRDLSSAELLLLAVDWFQVPVSTFSSLSHDEAARVLRDLTKPAGIGLWEAVSDAGASRSLRESTIRACTALFLDFFEPQCESKMVHLSQTSDPLNICCYLWWEDFPGSSLLPPHDGLPLRSAALDAMKAIWSRSGSVACRESVIHGLGDWAGDWGEPALVLLQEIADEVTGEPLGEYARRMLQLARRQPPFLPPTIH